MSLLNIYAQTLNLSAMEDYFVKNKQPSSQTLNDALLSSFSNDSPDEKRTPILNFLISKGADINSLSGDIINKIFYQNNIKNFEDVFDKIEFKKLITELPTLILWKHYYFFDLALHKIEQKFKNEIITLNINSLESTNPCQYELVQHLQIIQFHLKLKESITNPTKDTKKGKI